MLTWCRQKKQTSVDDDEVLFLKEEEVPTEYLNSALISSLNRAFIEP